MAVLACGGSTRRKHTDSGAMIYSALLSSVFSILDQRSA